MNDGMRGLKNAQVYEQTLAAMGQRKALGAYYTPAWMVNLLLDHALEPALAAAADPLSIRVCDPACGVGAFLVGAAQRIAKKAGVEVGVAAERCVVGIDVDPDALKIARAALREAGVEQPCLYQGDSLAAPPEGIDVFVGNPPFRNVFERSSPSAAQTRHSLLGGTADLAFEFVAMAADRLRPGGSIGFVVPRAFLGAPSAARLRAQLHPRMITLPTRSDHFPGAAVYVVLIVTGEPGSCQVSTGDSPEELRWRDVEGRDENWWRLLHPPHSISGDCLGQRFEVYSSLAAGEAYQIRERVTEDGAGMKLVTTGLIEPGACQWGIRPCRYLKRTYTRPKVDLNGLSPGIDRRVERARRPKILVAGLSKRIEAFFDSHGETFGAVSTYTLCDPEDDAEALRRLLRYLLSPEVNAQFHCELGASALGGGSITLTKAFLRRLSLRSAD